MIKRNDWKHAVLRDLARAQETLREQVTGSGRHQSGEAVRSKILQAIEQEGGTVTTERLRQIAGDLGYDPRGLGGFFHGRRRSLERTPDGLNRLTTRGRGLARLASDASGAGAPPLPEPLRLRSGRLASDLVLEGRR